jgi:hypothetical protein
MEGHSCSVGAMARWALHRPKKEDSLGQVQGGWDHEILLEPQRVLHNQLYCWVEDLK